MGKATKRKKTKEGRKEGMSEMRQLEGRKGRSRRQNRSYMSVCINVIFVCTPAYVHRACLEAARCTTGAPAWSEDQSEEGSVDRSIDRSDSINCMSVHGSSFFSKCLRDMFLF